jgi:hypothetical protein
MSDCRITVIIIQNLPLRYKWSIFGIVKKVIFPGIAESLGQG